MSIIFDEIDIWNTGEITFDSFSNFIIYKSSANINKVIINKVDAIKPYNISAKGIFLPKNADSLKFG